MNEWIHAENSASLFYSHVVQSPKPEVGATHFKARSFHIKEHSRQSPTDMSTDKPDPDSPSLKLFNQVVPVSVKLTIKISYHSEVSLFCFILFGSIDL